MYVYMYMYIYNSGCALVSTQRAPGMTQMPKFSSRDALNSKFHQQIVPHKMCGAGNNDFATIFTTISAMRENTKSHK